MKKRNFEFQKKESYTGAEAESLLEQQRNFLEGGFTADSEIVSKSLNEWKEKATATESVLSETTKKYQDLEYNTVIAPKFKKAYEGLQGKSEGFTRFIGEHKNKLMELKDDDKKLNEYVSEQKKNKEQNSLFFNYQAVPISQKINENLKNTPNATKKRVAGTIYYE